MAISNALINVVIRKVLVPIRKVLLTGQTEPLAELAENYVQTVSASQKANHHHPTASFVKEGGCFGWSENGMFSYFHGILQMLTMVPCQCRPSQS